MATEELEALRARAAELEEELISLKRTINDLETKTLDTDSQEDVSRWPLPLDDYRRYGRQMILDGFGLSAQLELKTASVLVVGAGGLGCPALQYLSAAGVGSIGIVDHDTVELSNLQRQILHTDKRVGWSKALSAEAAIREINPRVQVTTYPHLIDTSNALSIISSYSVVLDCTDNLPTRYLLSDVTSALHIPLVSGAALRYDGQLSVYNVGEEGPCYRCLFPKPPAIENVGSCEEMGVLGVVTGVIGTLQAMEAIKIIAGLNDFRPSLLVFSALSSPTFRSIKMRSKRESCAACGKGANRRGMIEATDYIAFCGGGEPNTRLRAGDNQGDGRIKPLALRERLGTDRPCILLDVRPSTEFEICHLPNAKNIPLKAFLSEPEELLTGNEEVYVVCRMGNDSQIAAEALRSAAIKGGFGVIVKDLVGGLVAWHNQADPNFPVY